MKKNWVLIICLIASFALVGCTKEAPATENATTAEEASEEKNKEKGMFSIQKMEGNDEESKNAAIPNYIITTKSIYDYDEEDYTTYYTGSLSTLCVDESVKDEFPDLYDNLKTYADDLNGQFDEASNKMKQTARQDYNAGGRDDDNFDSYTYNSNIIPKRADKDYLSYISSIESFMGGVHGDYAYIGVNYDVASGKELILSDIISDIPALQSKVIDIINKKYADAAFLVDLDEEVPKLLDGTKDQQSAFAITQRGIEIYFNPYELASYADGILTAEIDYTGNENLFTEAFKVPSGNYIEQLDQDKDYEIDLDGDGKCETISYFVKPDEVDEYYNLGYTIKVNGKELYVEDYSFDADLRLIHIGDKVYIYCERSLENDYVTTDMYIYKDGSLKKIDTYYGAFDGKSIKNTMEGDTYIYSGEYICNPENLYFRTRTDGLGTYSVYGKAEFSDDDKMTIKDNYYYAFMEEDENRKITLKKEINAYVVDDNHKASESPTKLSKGMVFVVYGTDTETFTDIKAEDGTIYRVYIKADDWPHLIDGEDIEELFENILFAG